jgi:hypothetical protein
MIDSSEIQEVTALPNKNLCHFSMHHIIAYQDKKKTEIFEVFISIKIWTVVFWADTI